MKKSKLVLFVLAICSCLNAQQTCEMALPAINGINEIPAEQPEDCWYYFVPSDYGTLVITSTNDLWVEVYTGTCNNLSYKESSDQNVTVESIIKHDTVFIRWYVIDPRNLNWNLEFKVQPGANCNYPDTAREGSNSLYVRGKSEHWYDFTMPCNGNLAISSDSYFGVNVYSGNCNNLTTLGFASASVDINGLSRGEQLHILWDMLDYDVLHWNLTIDCQGAGANCSQANRANEGSNLLTVTDQTEYWYTYTMPHEGKLVVSSTTKSNVTIYTSKCDNLKYLTNGYKNALVSTLKPGDQVYIKWENMEEGGFNWNLNVDQFNLGESCQLAKEVGEGSYHVPSTLCTYYWYTCTVPIEGKLEITSFGNEEMQIFTGLCDNLMLVNEGEGSALINTGTAGTKYYIRWYTKPNKGDFDWDLNIAPFITGEHCSVAETNVQNLNYFPPNQLTYMWYKYIMPSNGVLRLWSPSDVRARVYTGNCTNLKEVEPGHRLEVDFEDVNFYTLIAGDEVYIRWFRRYPGSTWSLDILPYNLGDICSIPKIATGGNNERPMNWNRHCWYTYAMPVDGNLNISMTTPYQMDQVHVYSGTCSDLSYIGGGIAEASVDNLFAGDMVYIDWHEVLNLGPACFNWNISIEPAEESENCYLAEEATEGVNTVPYTLKEYYWFTYTMPFDGHLFISTDANAHVNLYHGTCDNLLYRTNGYRKASTADVMAGQTIYIKWKREIGLNFDWTLNIIPDEKRSISLLNKSSSLYLYPNPVSTELYINPGRTKIEQLQLFSIDGRFIANYNPSVKVLNLENLRSGIYILRINTKNGLYTYKILKE